MHRANGKQLGTFGIGACWLALGINGLRLARIAELEHTGVFLRLAWMSPLQAYIASSLLLALGIYIIILSFTQDRQERKPKSDPNG